jgi:hypothetical protein
VCGGRVGKLKEMQFFVLGSGRVYRKIKNSISVPVPNHSDAIFSLGPSLQAFSPKPAFSKQGAGTRIKFLKMQQRSKLMWEVLPQAF